MKYLFGERKFLYERTPDSPKAVPAGGVKSSSLFETEQQKAEKKRAQEFVAGELEKGRKDAVDAAKKALEAMDPFKGTAKDIVKKAFSFMEKFADEKIKEMLAKSDKMAVYDLWKGGIARIKKDLGLEENQGFDRMVAQFAKQKVDDSGRAYLEVNLHGKDKFEMHIGAGHICPPSWTKVVIVDKNGNTKIGTRKVPGSNNVDGHKIGYYDENGEYLAVFSGYRIYPLSVLSENEVSEKKIIDEQVKKESEFYVKNKEKLKKDYSDSTPYSVKKMEMSSAEVQRIRDKIPGLEDIQDPGERVAAVAKWITENEKIYAKHCGNWVDRVYAIAGVQGKRDLYRNLDYAKGPDGKLGASRDAREGKHAIKQRPDLIANMRPGTWLWINNRNRFDVAGNHSVIFVGWKDKERKLAYCANWLNSNPDAQKISTIDFNRVPVVSITEPTAVEKKFERLSPEEMAREAEKRSQATPGRQRSSGAPSTSEAYESAKQALAGSDKSELASKGITPFTVKMGYQLTPEERTIYDRERQEAYRIGRMNVDARLDIMQQRYKLRDAIELSFRALRLQEKHKAYFYAYNDAVMRVESNYNPLCVNMKNGKVALSTASGAYQILNSVWTETCDKWLRETPKSSSYRKNYNSKVSQEYQIDYEMLKSVDFNQPLPGLATPYEHAIFHNIYAFQGSRMLKGVMAFDKVFDKLQSGQLSPEMRYSYQAYMYTNWRNGHGGAMIFLQMMNQGIPFPQNEAQAREYFDQMPDCWQKRRGFSDFRGLVRTCSAFVGRFNKNLKEMGAA